MRRSSAALTFTFISRRYALNLTRAPASLHVLASIFSWVWPACISSLCACTLPCGAPKDHQTTIAHRARDGQREGQPLQQHHPEQVRGNRELMSRGTVGKRNAGIAAEWDRKWARREARRLVSMVVFLNDESETEDPILPAALPLAGIPCFTCVRPLAFPQCGPTWTPPETLLVTTNCAI